MKFTRKLVTTLALLSLLTVTSATALSGCAKTEPITSNETEENKTNEGKENNTVLTSFYPIHVFTLAVTENTPIEVWNLTGAQGGCLHDYQLTTDDMRLISQSTTFVINGANMEESFIDKAISQNTEMTVVDSSLGIDIHEEEEHIHEEGEEHDHEDEHVHGNSHIWLSVSNAMVQVNNIATQLSEIYPDYADTFAENAQNYCAKLEEIKPETKDYDFSVISFHNTFEFLAQDMGFRVAESIEVEENSTPSASLMASLVEMCNAGEIDYILSADDIGKTYAETISNETGIPVLVLDPFTNVETDPEAYITAQKANISALKAVLENE